MTEGPSLLERLAALSPEQRTRLRARLESGAQGPEAPQAQGQPRLASSAQLRLWMLDHIIEERAAYHVPVRLRLHVEGKLALERLVASVDAVLDRHDALRVSLEFDGKQLLQHIHPRGWLLGLTQRRVADQNETPDDARMRFRRWARAPFELERGPLARTRVEARGDHLELWMCFHHAVVDAVSLSLIASELETLWAAGSSDPDLLPAAPLGAYERALDEARGQLARAAEPALRWWTDYLDPSPPPLELPGLSSRSGAMAYRGHAHERLAAGTLAQQVEALARARGVTPFVVSLAAFFAVLYRYTGEGALAVSVPWSLREGAQSGLVGLFINTVVVRAHVTAAMSGAELIDALARELAQLRPHAWLPFDRVIQAVSPERSLQRSPIVELLFNYVEGGGLGLDLGDVQVEPLPAGLGTARVDLSLELRRVDAGVRATLEHADDRMDLRTSAGLLDAYLRLLADMCAKPRQELGRLALLGEAQRDRLLKTWSGLELEPLPAVAPAACATPQPHAEPAWRTSSSSPIAVVGLACRVPGASTPERLWELLRDGEIGLTSVSREQALAAGVPEHRLRDPRHVSVAGMIEEPELFDAARFNMTPAAAALTDPQHRLLLESCLDALESVGLERGRARRRVGVFASASPPSYLFDRVLGEGGIEALESDPRALLGNTPDTLATRVAYHLDLGGPALTIQSGCSSSLVALHQARLALLAGDCDLALVAAASVSIPQEAGYLHVPGGVSSSDGRCRPFDQRAEGTVFSNAIVVTVLERLADARRERRAIFAVVEGSAIGNDGAQRAGFSAPGVEGQSEVLARALADSGREARELSFIETHGTATRIGDQIEVSALERVYGDASGPRCWLGSVKASVGHADVAAGLVGFAKLCLMLRERSLVPTPGFERPNPTLQLERTRFAVCTQTQPWAGPRVAGLSSFGVGGTNAHAILTEAPPRETPAIEPEAWAAPSLLLWSATSLHAACALGERLTGALTSESTADLAWSLHRGRTSEPVRAFAIAGELAGGKLNSRVATRPATRAPLVLLLPGQGNHDALRLRALVRGWPALERRLEPSFAQLRHAQPELGERLRRLLLGTQPPTDTGWLDEPCAGQVLAFVLQLALGQELLELGLEPTALIGHSVGELAAATLAGLWAPATALELVLRRGELQAQAPAGEMRAVIGDPEQLAASLPAGVEIAARNGARLSVVAGTPEAIAQLEALGIAGLHLRTRRAFHSAAMDPAARAFAELVAGAPTQTPRLELISSLRGSQVAAQELRDPGHWRRQMREVVRFDLALAAAERRHPGAIYIELGPGDQLTRLVRRELAQPERAWALDGGSPCASLEALGQLWLAGHELDADVLHEGDRRRRVLLPSTPRSPQRAWIERAHRPRSRPQRSLAQLERSEWLWRMQWRGVAWPVQPPTPERWQLVGGSAVQREELSAAMQGACARMPSSVSSGSPRPWLLLLHGLDPEGDPAAAIVALFAQLAARVDDELGGLVLLTRGAFGPGGHEPNPLAAALRSALQGFAQERPGLAWSVIDVGHTPLPLVAARLAGLGAAPLPAPRLALRGAEVLEPCFEAFEGEDESAPVGEQRVLVLGGLGELGLIHARALASTPGLRLCLVGRSPAPERARWAELAHGDGRAARQARALTELDAALGASLLLREADACDAGQLDALFSELERSWGGIDLVVHAVGAPAASHYCAARDVNLDVARTLLEPKRRSLELLAARAHAVRRCVIVSSISALIGGVGLGLYAAVHAWIGAFAAARARDSLARGGPRWELVEWDAWDIPAEDEDEASSGVGDGLRQLAIPLEAGPALVRRAFVRSAAGPLCVSTSALGLRYDAWVRQRIVQAHTSTRGPRPPLAVPYVAPATRRELSIAELWAELLGLERVGIDDGFFELGGDSLLALQLVALLRERAGVQLGLLELFEHATVRGIVALGAGEDHTDEARTTARASRQKAALARQRARRRGGRRA